MFTIDGEMAQRRRFIKNKLEHEKQMLSEIEESMQTSNELTNNMSEILESFSGKVTKLEKNSSLVRALLLLT